VKNCIFLDVTPCGSCNSRRFGGMYRLHHQDGKNRPAKNNINSECVVRLLVTPDVVPSSPILVTLMMEAISSSLMSAHTRTTRRNIPEYGILHSHHRENHKSYMALTGWVL
jgi:hypothetical protein